jgi:hypothetical protein
LARRPNGTTDVDVVVVREDKNLKGRLLGFVLGTVGKGVSEKAFAKSIKQRSPESKGRTMSDRPIA